MKDFFNLSIADILSGFRNKTFTPLDIAGICKDQVKLLDKKYRAWEVFDGDILIKQAKISDKNIQGKKPVRPLEGIPIGIKDIFNTYDFPTEMGSPIWRDFTPGNDARVVFDLRQAGALIPGKTVTAEFAVHTLDKTRNPHNPNHLPGTSSSGSAVAIALGMVPAATGTQTAGSIVRPASFCGVYGCKPSYGLIPRTGILKTTDTLDTVGFFVGKACDMATVFNAIRVHGKDYPISHAILSDNKRQSKSKGKPWKIAFVKTHTWENVPLYAKRAIADKMESFSKDNHLIVAEVDLPSIMTDSHKVHEIIYDKCLSYYFRDEFKKGKLVSPIMRELIEHGNNISTDEFHQALQIQTKMAETMDDFFAEYDIMATLSTAGAAPLRTERELPDPALMWTMTYLPVVSVPAFVSPGGLPFGLQVVARKYNDLLLFEFINYLVSREMIPEGQNPFPGI